MKKVMSLIFAVLMGTVMCLPAMAAEGDEKPNIIIDNGTGYTQANFQGLESPSDLGSTISEGNGWIITGIGAAAVVAVAAVVIKKEESPASANGNETGRTEK